MNKKQFMGIVTVSLIIGGTIYCIKKYKDDAKYGEPISLEEARELVKAREEEALRTTEETAEALGMDKDEIEELVEVARDDATLDSTFVNDNTSYDFYDGLDWNTPLSQYITEEDKVMRFEPNTMQARDHFIKMELADLTPGMEEYQIMKRLYDFQFEPLNEGDGILYSQLADYREEFFGPNSRWNDNVSFADIIAHYARLTDYNIGGGIGTWIVKFTRYIEVSELATADAISEVITALNQHNYHNQSIDVYGLFGLSFDDCVVAEETADGTVDGALTYEIEFNTFLNSIA